jgi:hypothetical protein
MYTFTSTYGDGIKVSGIESGISSKDMELLSWVCNAYGFLLPRKEKIDTKTFAELIDDYYSQDDFHNKLAYTFLMELHNKEED